MEEYVKASDIFTIDAHYYREQLAAIHLIRSQGRVCIIDTGTMYSIDNVARGLAELGLTFDHVDYIILTHIHLDHAGGAGELMALCESAKLVVHPRGAKHMADPGKLVAGARAVYGEEAFNKLYGTIKPIDTARIVEPEDGEILDWADRPLTFIDTPGHASHHHCIIDSQTNSVFTGDTLGVAYRALRSETCRFVMPTTTPVQFNPDALHQSIDNVMSYQPNTLYLTHYSAVTPTASMIAGLHEQIDDYVMLTEQAAAAHGDNFEQTLMDSINHYLVQRCQTMLPNIEIDTIKKWVTLDADLNAQGLAFWWNHKRQ